MKPVVYIDVLFLINFVINYFLLLTTKKICKSTSKSWRVLVGALIGSLYAILMFFPPLAIYYTIFAKLLFSLILIAVSFRITKWREFLRTTVIFYIVNFMFAGAAFALFYFTDIGSHVGAMVSNGVFYFDLPLKTLFISTGVSYAVILIACKIYSAKMTSGKVYDICICYREKSACVSALLDTGNSLSDPVSGKPVIVTEFDSVKALFPSEISSLFLKYRNDDSGLLNVVMSTYFKDTPFRLIPFCSLGNQHGMLLAFKADRVVLVQENQELNEVLIGVYNKKLSKSQEYKALLHPGLVA